VRKKYRSGYFCVKQNSPRMETIWKGWIGEPRQHNEVEKRQSKEIQSLKRTTAYLAAGEAVLAIGEVVGFGLTASDLINKGSRLNRLEAIISAVNAGNPLGFVCPECLHPLRDLMDSFCSECGAIIDWTHWIQKPPAGEPASGLCPCCAYPTRLNQRFCTKCGKALSIPISTDSGLQLVPVRSWGLP